MKIVHTKPILHSTSSLMMSWCNKHLGYGGLKNTWFDWEEIEEIRWVVEYHGSALKFTFLDDKAVSMFMLKYGEHV